MHADIAKKWCDALESDEYQQKRGTLCQTVNGSTGFCCLGVLTDLYIKATGSGRWARTEIQPISGATTKGFVNGREDDGYYLPVCVKRWSGLASSDPVVDYHGNPTQLSDLNDNKSLDFHSIARLIRDNQEKM